MPMIEVASTISETINSKYPENCLSGMKGKQPIVYQTAHCICTKCTNQRVWDLVSSEHYRV